jgi:hypothetical protein
MPQKYPCSPAIPATLVNIEDLDCARAERAKHFCRPSYDHGTAHHAVAETVEAAGRSQRKVLPRFADAVHAKTGCFIDTAAKIVPRCEPDGARAICTQQLAVFRARISRLPDP